MIAVREHLVLLWQKRTAGIDEIQTRQAVLLSYLLSAQMFLDR